MNGLMKSLEQKLTDAASAARLAEICIQQATAIMTDIDISGEACCESVSNESLKGKLEYLRSRCADIVLRMHRLHFELHWRREDSLEHESGGGSPPGGE